MDRPSPPNARRTPPYDALGLLLGVKGPLRLLPQGSTPKPHIIIKRDYSKDGGGDGEISDNIARFSFVAGKKFTVNKGQPLLFAVACPTDRDGKALFNDGDTFLLEGDLEDDSEEDGAEESARSGGGGHRRKARLNVAGLPPKMRKCLTRTKAYAAYAGGKPSPSLSFPGYPLGVAPPRAYATASAQTDPPSALVPPQTISTPTTQSFPLQHSEKSPLQLPSPVSADHAREAVHHDFDHFDDEETDNYSRAERSLSPMDLSSDTSSPNTSPAVGHEALPEENVASSLSKLASNQFYPSTTQITVERADNYDDAQMHAPMVNTVKLPRSVSPRAPTDEPSNLLSFTSTAKKDIPEEPKSPFSSTTASVHDSPQGLAVKKELMETLEKPPTVAPVVEISPLQNHALAREAKDVPMEPRTTIRESSTPPVSRKPPLAAPKFVKSSVSSINSTWETSPPPPVPYIPASTSSNPLGIRPSSSLHFSQRAAPTGPRSLLGMSATPAPPKKPIVVGAKWSAARSSSSSNASNGGLSTSSSTSSSLSSLPSSLPSSPVIPTTSAPTSKINLSQILQYASPSPPPPEPSAPPPPTPPPPTSESKWKRISGADEKTTSTAVSTSVPAVERSTNPLKRPHECLTQPVEPKPPSATPVSGARGEISWIALPERARNMSLVSSANKAKPTQPLASFLRGKPPMYAAPQSTPKVPNAAPNFSQPLTHPLPPKPIVTGSSYRPLKRERSLDPSESRRPTRTDWPATQPACNHRVKSSRAGADAGVMKIMFNSDGMQIALLCADRTVRIWSNMAAASKELAMLTHNSDIVSMCWTEDSSVMTLCVDGSVNTWSRGIGNEWKSAKLLTVPEMAVHKDAQFCLTYTGNRIAISMPSGVKVWFLMSGTWQLQREIVRSGVTAIKFVHDGNALIGGCRDGVLWYCEVPNGTIRVHSFLQQTIHSIDLHPTGQYLLISQDGGKTHLISLRANENKGSVERTYTSEKIQMMAQNSKGFSAVFATKGQAVLYGTVNGCALVWDRKKGAIVYGLKHPDGDPVHAAATSDGRPGVEGWMITGTKQGRLFWWPQPVAVAPTYGGSGSGTPDDSRKRQKVV